MCFCFLCGFGFSWRVLANANREDWPVRPPKRFCRSSTCPETMVVPGASSQTLTGEIGLSEFQNVFAEVFICPETMELLPESLRETHFEGTVTCFEFAWPIGWKSRTGKGPSWHPPAGVRGGLTVCRNGGRGPVGIRQLGSGRPRPRNGRPCGLLFSDFAMSDCRNGFVIPIDLSRKGEKEPRNVVRNEF